MSSVAPTNCPPPSVWWVDGGGGFLVRGGSSLTVGRRDCDINVIAGGPTRWATLVRQSDDAWIEPSDAWSGRRTSIGDHQTIRLAAGSPSFEFRRPTPLSQTRVISVDRATRLEDSIDAVLWVGKMFLIGPTPDCHIVVRHAESKIPVMFRDGKFFARRDGQTCPIDAGQRWEHAAVSLSWRPTENS